MKPRYLITVLCLLLSLSVLAQTTEREEGMRIGYLNRQQIVAALPAAIQAEAMLAKQQSEFETEYQRMEQEYNEKVKHYIENNKTMSEPIRMARMTEITELEKRMVLFKQRYTETLQQQRNKFYEPINARVDAAIKLVAENNNIDYVFNQGTELYVSKRCIDLNAYVLTVLLQE
ncbi:MAG: OmpH family outer membrane protein [Bacteroidales bacterium]|nr:OmpH family outer membrane protein [Bacteroidales bacterium]